MSNTLRISRRSAILAGLALIALASAAPVRAEYDLSFTAGHADIGVEYEDGNTFDVHYHFGAGAVLDGVPLPGGLPSEAYHYEADQAHIFVPLSSSGPRPAGSQWDFLGNAAGETIYFLPQTNTPGLPFLGFATTDELNPADWIGRITWTLTDLIGPGAFSIYSTGFFGTPNPVMATSDGLPDSINQSAGVHAHYNFGFTAPGTYDATFAVQGTHQSAGLVTGAGTFRFQVGPAATVVPEPASVALCGVGAGGLLFVHSMRRRSKSSSTAA